MPRPLTVHVCSSCGHAEARWHGSARACGAWNTLVEERAPAARARPDGGGAAARRQARRPGPSRCATSAPERAPRLPTGIGELDRVPGRRPRPRLAGPAGRLAGHRQVDADEHGPRAPGGRRHDTLYVSGEESAAQIRLRAERLARGAVPAALDVPVLAETDLDAVCAVLEAAAAGGLRRRLRADPLGRRARRRAGQRRPGPRGRHPHPRGRQAQGTAVLLVGHVTKEGALAGPRVLEHLVDCVLQFEGERERTYRTLRAHKNRFGATNDVGVFEMREGGLVEVLDASARFVAEATRAPGSVCSASMEGSRPLLVEVQALVSPSELVPPRRVCTGYDRNRLALVLAVLGRHAGVGVGGADVFVNVVGGVRIDEPGADLAVALAVASAARGVVCGGEQAPVACFGEVGLTGELRSVAHPERRLAEAAKFGLAQVGLAGGMPDAARGRACSAGRRPGSRLTWPCRSPPCSPWSSSPWGRRPPGPGRRSTRPRAPCATTPSTSTRRPIRA
jgi:DNA repair protein RadA/Sms